MKLFQVSLKLIQMTLILPKRMNRLPWLLICSVLNIIIVSSLAGFSGVIRNKRCTYFISKPLILGQWQEILVLLQLPILKLQNNHPKYLYSFEIGFIGIISRWWL